MRNVEITSGEYYHVYNRAIDGRVIFENSNDFRRFQALLFFCNLRGASLPNHLGRLCGSTLSVAQRREIQVLDREYERHVEVCVYSIMPNHFHIKISPNHGDGCEKFLHKLEMSYSKYCNAKLDRNGHVFQGSYEAVHVSSDQQWQHLTNYIHGNPLDLFMPKWRDGNIADWRDAEEFLKNYKWSSLPVFSGCSETYPVLDREYTETRFAKPEDVLLELKEWCERGVDTYDIPGAWLE